MKYYLFLLAAIALETVGTSCLKLSEGFTKPIPTAILIITYIAAFFFLSLTLKAVPVGIAYGIWSALGIVLVTIVGIFAFKQIPDTPAIIGLALIVIGVVIINVWSKTSVH